MAMSEKINCRCPDPYPEITCTAPNPHDVALIRPLYAGNLSELTAILQYCYQHTVLEKACPEASSAIAAIAAVEMHHLHLLSVALFTMGCQPKYANPNIHNWWNAGIICNEQNLCKVLLKNLKDETDAHSAYLAIACKVNNPTLAALLRRIAQDEKMHMDLFTNMINCHCRKK